VFIKLSVEGKFDAFYEELRQLLLEIAGEPASRAPLAAVEDAVRLNRSLVSQPFKPDDITVTVGFNLIDFWQGIREGAPVPLASGAFPVRIERSRSYYADLDRWCREVVWWGNKKGAYLYPNREVSRPERQLAGHY